MFELAYFVFRKAHGTYSWRAFSHIHGKQIIYFLYKLFIFIYLIYTDSFSSTWDLLVRPVSDKPSNYVND